MIDINWFTFSFELFDLLANLSSSVWGFFNYEISIVGITTITIWQILGGTGIVVIMVAVIVKAVAPFL